MDWTQAGYAVSDDPAGLDPVAIHAFLSRSYWANGIPLATVERSLRQSLCFGLYAPEGAQVGFARVVTDRATFGYLCDVYVLEEHRGRGLARFLIRCVDSHPDLQGLRRFMLATADAHDLYAKHGFARPARPERLMERLDPDAYKR